MYDKFPVIEVGADERACAVGWSEIAQQVLSRVPARDALVCVECYPGALLDDLARGLQAELQPEHVLRAETCYLPVADIEHRVREYLTDDPVFGRMNSLEIADFLELGRVEQARDSLRGPGLRLVIGTGAALIALQWDLLIYADLARWEIQQRYRRKQIGNLGVENTNEKASLKYKRAFFVDWRAADRLKVTLLPKADLLLDSNNPERPKAISGDDLRRGLQLATERPFRLVPFFDPGPWGGHWMEQVCDLPRDKPNYAWCFDCVPEENSLLLGFGTRRVEIPALDLVLMQPLRLLGEEVVRQFGAEFPIRFDFLDTMDGGNLSLQVHPLQSYIRERFGMTYTQDESYYLLDGREDSSVYLGLRDGVDPEAMARDLRAAATSPRAGFNAEKYVNKIPARKHDHFLIPAGTVHCSGRNSMVLEISATPYLFTFKLWDWARLDLDGLPRPLHLDHGLANVCWDRRTKWVQQNLVNRVEQLNSGDGWREERTGLHPLEFIETRRHWFTQMVPHHTQGMVNVLNLVEGDCVIVESPESRFAPFEVHYAETFVVPAAVGAYTIRPAAHRDGRQYATLKAFVRNTERTAEPKTPA